AWGGGVSRAILIASAIFKKISTARLLSAGLASLYAATPPRKLEAGTLAGFALRRASRTASMSFWLISCDLEGGVGILSPRMTCSMTEGSPELITYLPLSSQ